MITEIGAWIVSAGMVSTGLFCLVVVLTDRDWFFNNPNVAFVVRILTRRGARLFYGLVGLCALAMGVIIVSEILY